MLAVHAQRVIIFCLVVDNYRTRTTGFPTTAISEAEKDSHGI